MSYLYHTILKKIRRAYKSKHNFKRENQVILLMITNGKKIALPWCKEGASITQRNKTNHNGNFYCLKCFHSYSTKTKHKEHEGLCNYHDYYYVEMPNEDDKILKYCP